jgi:hypothetical protein
MIKSFTYILLSATICTNAIAQTVRKQLDDINVQATLSQTTLTVGDTVELRIEATTPEGTTLSIDDGSSFGSFSIVDSKTLLDIPSDTGRKWTWSMQLDTFDASATALDGVVINWSSPSGENGSITLDPIPIEIKSVAGDSLADMTIRDIKAPVALFTKSANFAIIASIVIALALCLLLYRFFRGNKPALSPNEKAMSAIQELKGTHLEVHSFYTSLSDIVRHYLEAQFHIAASGQTTREFLNAAKQNPRLEQTDRESLGSFLVAADLVKFARHEPGNNVNEEAINRAETFIQETAKVSL